jgi:hypothetical protein
MFLRRDLKLKLEIIGLGKADKSFKFLCKKFFFIENKKVLVTQDLKKTNNIYLDIKNFFIENKKVLVTT